MITEATRGRITIKATLEGLGDSLRLSIHIKDGLRLEERGMTVGDPAEADRQVTAFAARFPGAPIERLGDAWAPPRHP